MAKNLHEFLRKNIELAVNDFQMIQPGDRILVGISGGADSFTLLKVLSGRKIFIPQDITLIPAYVDLGFRGDDTSHIDSLQSYFEQNGYEYHIDRTAIGLYAHSEKNRKKPCFLCSRMRRTRLFEIADKFNCKKIALGHHKDDIIETLLINIFFAREIATMNPNQPFFKGKYHVIRPLVYVLEKKIKRYAEMNEFPVFENRCPSAKTSHRNIIKTILQDLERKHKGVKENIFKSLRQVKRNYIWGIIDRD